MKTKKAKPFISKTLTRTLHCSPVPAEPVRYFIQHHNPSGQNWIDHLGLNPVLELSEEQARQMFSAHVAEYATSAEQSRTFRLVARTDRVLADMAGAYVPAPEPSLANAS